MKILHIGKFFPPHRGGMETFLRDLMMEQKRQGLEVSAIVHNSERSLRSTTNRYIWRDQTLPVTRVARWTTLAFTPISPMFIWHLWRLIRRQRPDVLHFHMPNPSVFWCLLLPSARRIPWVIQWQSDVLPSPFQPVLRMLYWIYSVPERLVLEHAERIIASSPNYLDSSLTLRPWRDKCRVIPLAIEDPMPKGYRRVNASAQTSSLFVLAVGRLTYYKGFNVLISAIALCPEASLNLVGAGEERESLETLSKELGVTNRVVFMGNCDDETLESLYDSSDLLCLPSIERTESFGMVLLESMARGLPCVVSDVPGSGMSWVMGGADSGTLVPPNDVAALAKMLNRLQGERDILATMSRRGRERFEECFSLSFCAEQISSLYADIL